MTLQEARWLRERHKPFKGSSKSKASKKGRTKQQATGTKSTKTLSSKADRINASRMAAKLKKERRIEASKANAAIKPIVTVVEITRHCNPISFNLKSAILRYFPHGSLIPDIVNAASISDVLLLVVAPNIPSDAWSENAQFAIRSQGFPSSTAIVVSEEPMAPPVSLDVTNEWAAYLSDRYSKAFADMKKHIYPIPSHLAQLEAFIMSSDRIHKALKSNVFVVESYSDFDAENRSVKFHGFIRGSSVFAENEAIIAPGCLQPIANWTLATASGMDLDHGSISSQVHKHPHCSCQVDTVSEEKLSDGAVHSAKPSSTVATPVSSKHASDYQAAWLSDIEEDEEYANMSPADEAQGRQEMDIDANLPDLQETNDEVEFDSDNEFNEDIISYPKEGLIKNVLTEYRPLQYFASQEKSCFTPAKKNASPFIGRPYEPLCLTLENLPTVIEETHIARISFLYAVPVAVCSKCGNTFSRKKTAFSIQFISGIEKIPSKMHVQIGPWCSNSEILFAIEHTTFISGNPFVYRRVVKQSDSMHRQYNQAHAVVGLIDCPGAEFDLPLAFSLSTPIFIYGDDGLLLASGRVVVKDIKLFQRATLVGYPCKIHKRSAVIRGMFGSPEDVEYFSPLELVTRSGRKGYIKESLGTHGLMKVSFNRPIARQEPVFMHLYKQIQ